MRKIKFFSYGILGAAMSLVFQTIILVISGKESLPDNFWKEAGLLLAVFVLVEELLRLAFVEKIILQEGSSLSGAVFLGLGFSFLEIALSCLKGLPEANFWPNIFMLSGILAVHLTTSAIAGKMTLVPSFRPIFSHRLKILAPAFLLHFLYNIVIIKVF